MESEWDVVHAIVQCIKQLGTVDLRHVKGHQTEKCADQPLWSLSAKLNNEADAIAATTFQEHTNHRDDLVIPITGSQAYLHADAVFPITISDGADGNFLPRRTITRGVRKFLRDIYGTRRICEHIQDKKGWTAMSSIPSIGSALAVPWPTRRNPELSLSNSSTTISLSARE
jgi:hypothetical protein